MQVNIILYIFLLNVLGEGSIEYFHFKVNNFEHFEYIYKLTKNYTQNDVLMNDMQLKDIIIKIGVVGKFTEDNLNLFPKGNVVRRKLYSCKCMVDEQ